MRFAIFPVHLSKVLRLPRKSDARSLRSAAPVTQNHLSKREDLRLQNVTPLRKSAPGPPNSSDEDVSCTVPATENASLQILVKCPTPAIVLLILTRCTIPCACHAKPHLNVQKCSVPHIFCTFDFEMCFAPQRPALYRHRKSQLLKVVRSWCALYILTSKCASCHNGVQFFISPLASWLRTRRFSEPTFRPSGATNHRKNTVLRDFPTFSRAWIFFLLTLSLL